MLIALLARWLAANRDGGFGVDFSPDWRVALVTMFIAGAAVVATGVGPALRGTRRLVATARSDDAPLPARSWLLVIQVGLSAVLVVVASLLGRAVFRAGSLDPGFDAAGARVVVRLPAADSSDPRLADVRAGMQDVLDADGSHLIADAGYARLFERVS